MPEAPFVRRATEDDVGSILGLIKELADFEKCPDRVIATEEQLKKTLDFAPGASSPTPKAGYAKVFLLIVPQDDKDDTYETAGFALFFHNYSTWLGVPGIYLEDLYIQPKYRRRGFATILLKKVAYEAKKISDGKGRLEWSCLKWNEGALGFYKRIGAERQDEWVGLRIEGQGLSDLINMKVNVTE